MPDEEPVGDDEADLDEWTRDWLEARADEADVPPDVLLERFAAAFRAAEEGDIPQVVRRPELADARADLDDLRTDVDDMIRDVRQRVIQVKRETDAKAPADHTHDDLAERLEGVAETAASARSDVEAVESAVDALEDRVDDGFENFEEILSYLTDAVDDLEAKHTRLARAALSMREGLTGVTEREGRRFAADRLREQANTHGVRTATCADCDATLDVALLTDARCPHCASTFASVEPKRGFFGSPTLEVGDRPALEAPDVRESEASPLADLAADGDGRPDTPADLAGREERSTGEPGVRDGEGR